MSSILQVLASLFLASMAIGSLIIIMVVGIFVIAINWFVKRMEKLFGIE